WDSATDEIEVLWNPMDHSLKFFVSPIACYEEQVDLAHPDPQAQFLSEFRAQLDKRQISVLGSDPPLPGNNLKLLGSYLSLPLAKLAQVLMKESQNHYADLFWLTTAAHHQALTLDEAESVNLNFLDEIFARLGWAKTKGSQFRDGSGLSQQNNIKPRELAALLTYALNQPWAAEWLKTLPVMGVDGTLESRGNAATRARVFAKTGYINRVRTLSGYVLSAENEPLIFSVMVNNYSCPTRLISSAQDQICAILAQLHRRKRPNKPINLEIFPNPADFK
ncbi:MAG: D-alanyl-D-alanine carboxypeptidase, partial [Acidobacteria bacterium]|nr:D-alanyl-D-alanine carboxypeptidase [Acidobacteriota bacterium]